MEDDDSLIYFMGEGDEKLKLKLTSKLITGNDGKHHLIWYDEGFVKKFSFEKIFVDGTFKIRPKMFWTRKSQFLTIMSKYNGKVRTI